MFVVTKLAAMGAIEILAAGKVVKIEFLVDLQGQIDRSYLILLFVCHFPGYPINIKACGAFFLYTPS